LKTALCLIAVLFGLAPPAQAAEYKLCPQDVIEIHVWQHDDLSRVFTIESDGTMSFPLAGQMQAGGKSVAELSSELVKRISKYIPNPQVTITVRQYSGLSVTVLGSVMKSGHYSIAGDKNLLDVLAEAGGAAQGANLAKIRIIRNGHSDVVDLRPVLEGKKELLAKLEPGNTVYVPEKWWAWMDMRGMQMVLTLGVLVLQIITLAQ